MTDEEKEEEDYDYWLDAVKADGKNIEFVPEEFKTPELCLEAIKADCFSLSIIPKPPWSEEYDEGIDGGDIFIDDTGCNTMLKFVPKDFLNSLHALCYFIVICHCCLRATRCSCCKHGG